MSVMSSRFRCWSTLTGLMLISFVYFFPASARPIAFFNYLSTQAFLLPITTSPWKWPVNVVGENSPFILAMLSDGPYGQAGSSNVRSVLIAIK
jgi:hypothetical protein